MAAHVLLLTVLAAPLAYAQSSFSGVWHLVNAQSVICRGAPGYALINMSQPAGELSKPHIFTIFRTTNASVSLDFTATDATGKQVAKQAVTLQQATRRLQEIEVEWVETWQVEPRQLSARRRGGGGGGGMMSSPRRRAPSPAPRPAPQPSYTSPRRRAPTSTGGTGTGTAGSRRRTYGYDNKVHSNPYNPGAGNYGYATPGAASSNFGGRLPTGTPYGYTGANAYSGSSGSAGKIAMAAGGGLLAGYLGSQLLSHTWTGFNREQMLNMPCTSGSWSGLCSTCVTLHGAEKCNIEMSPKIDATRDDLLNTGFVPSTVAWPIIVNITKLAGVDFDPSKVCPNISDPNAFSPMQTQIFLTLTTLQELASEPAAKAASSSPFGSMWSILGGLLVLGGCCCCAVFAFRASTKGSAYGGGYGSSSESDWSDDHGPGYGHPGPGYQGGYPGGYQGGYGGGQAPYQAQMAQPQYSPWQGGAVAGVAGATMAPMAHGVVVQGSPVAMGSFRSGGFGGGFMDTAAPAGMSWREYCQHEDVRLDSMGMIDGRWGECLAWAVVYERQTPGWQHDPRFATEGPAGEVVAAIEAKGQHLGPMAVQGAEKLEDVCQRALQQALPVPRIGRVIA